MNQLSGLQSELRSLHEAHNLAKQLAEVEAKISSIQGTAPQLRTLIDSYRQTLIDLEASSAPDISIVKLKIWIEDALLRLRDLTGEDY